MARSMWRGAIQFGLVTIPVKLYLATEQRGGLSFHLLHKSCLTRVQMQTYCPHHETTISRSDTVRGYEWAKGQYVVVDEGDFESVPLKTVRSIEIESFVTASDAQHTQFVKQAYYLEPDPVGRKPFYLLKSVLAEDGLEAICKVVLRDREVLASLNPYAQTIMMNTLYWPDEIRALDELELPEDEFTFKPAELTMARQLVGAMTGEFDASAYRDEYREALMNVIQAKIDGQPVERPEPAPDTGKLVDLMSALEASVAAARQSRSDGTDEKTAADHAETSPTSVATKKRRTRSATERKEGDSRAKSADDDQATEKAEPSTARPQRRRKSA